MGGYGSLILSLRHPDLFTACAPLSAGVVTDRQYIELDQPQYDKMFSWIFGPGLEGEARINDHYKKYSPLHMISNQPADSTARVRYYIDCGDDDWLSPGNAELHILMKNMGIPHEYRVRDGAHDWEYWRTGLVDALKFISVSFTR
jgi:S-formylglutathione hydrolase FrmB